MKLSEVQQEFTFDVSLLIQHAYGLGIRLTVGNAHRTESQMVLNYLGYDVVIQSNKPVFVKRPRTSKTLNSTHGERRAIDFNFFKDGKLMEEKEIRASKEIALIGSFWKSLNEKNIWGGDWKTPYDPYHFQRDR